MDDGDHEWSEVGEWQWPVDDDDEASEERQRQPVGYYPRDVSLGEAMYEKWLRTMLDSGP